MHKISKPFHENKKYRTLDDNIDLKPKCCYLFSAIGGGMQQKENNKGKKKRGEKRNGHFFCLSALASHKTKE